MDSDFRKSITITKTFVLAYYLISNIKKKIRIKLLKGSMGYSFVMVFWYQGSWAETTESRVIVRIPQ